MTTQTFRLTHPGLVERPFRRPVRLAHRRGLAGAARTRKSRRPEGLRCSGWSGSRSSVGSA